MNDREQSTQPATHDHQLNRLADAGLNRGLLGDFLASGNRSLLLAWARVELHRQLDEDETMDRKSITDEEIPF